MNEFGLRYDFDTPVNRRGSDSSKWSRFGDALPLWVADMDFRSPEPVIQALHRRVDEGVFGYVDVPPSLKEVLRDRLAQRHQVSVRVEDILCLPGLVVGLNLVSRSVGQAGDGIAILTPAYPPFFKAINNAGRVLQRTPMARTVNGSLQQFEIDFDALERAITPRTRLLLLANPHNPVGRVYRRAELERLAEIALRHDLIVCSDEVHCDLIFDGPHISFASLGPEVARRTITLLAASKTFNIPGLGCGFAVTTNPELLGRLYATAEGISGHVNIMGYVASEAAYRDGQPWLDALLDYLRANRDLVVDYVTRHFPDFRVTCPEGTYLAWIDCRALGVADPFRFFLEEANVALQDGAAFGPDGEGFLRLNFGCPRSTLTEALERMRAAVAQREPGAD